MVFHPGLNTITTAFMLHLLDGQHRQKNGWKMMFPKNELICHISWPKSVLVRQNQELIISHLISHILSHPLKNLPLIPSLSFSRSLRGCTAAARPPVRFSQVSVNPTGLMAITQLVCWLTGSLDELLPTLLAVWSTCSSLRIGDGTTSSVWIIYDLPSRRGDQTNVDWCMLPIIHNQRKNIQYMFWYDWICSDICPQS